MTSLRCFPILWVGPSGKITEARKALGSTDLTLRTLQIGDYTARYWEASTHMEIDIMDLSMMDKQILPEMLNQLLSTRDVLGSGRKLMILRRLHALSPPAAIRLRACLEELVWAPGAPAMIWGTTRHINHTLVGLLDGFVYRRVQASGGNIRQDLAQSLNKKITDVPTISSYINDMMRQMVFALQEGPPTLEAAKWVRARVYELLGLMITGSELTAGLVWSTVRLAAAGAITDAQATRVLDTLARVRWVPSYRTPLILEMIVAAVYQALSVT
jgi:hypothetical protein